MKPELIRASVDDAELIWKMQVDAFAGLLEKYQDFDTSPANETADRVKQRLEMQDTYFYLLKWEGEYVGAIRICHPSDPDQRKRISPLFILPRYRNRGFAQAAIAEAEKIHGEHSWTLGTILQEKGNCHLYEKMGYRPTGEDKVINDKMTLIFYEK